MFQICGDVEAVGFPLQNVYKMTYGNENATFESRCKRETFKPVNGYNNRLFFINKESFYWLF